MLCAASLIGPRAASRHKLAISAPEYPVLQKHFDVQLLPTHTIVPREKLNFTKWIIYFAM